MATPSRAIDVSSCGTNLSTRGATYNLTSDLVCNGAGPHLNVTAANPANIIIDCGGFEITFQGTAIDLGDRDNIEIRNCTLSTAATNYSSSAFTWFAINGFNDSASNIWVHHNTFNLVHDAAPEALGFMVSNLASDNVLIEDNECYIGGAYRSTCFEVTGAGNKTNWRILSNLVRATGTSNGRPTGISLIGSIGAEVAYNDIQVNTSGTIGDIDEFQSISCYGCVNPNWHHNTITEYGTHGRVFTVDNMNGGSIHHNTINLWGNGRVGGLQGIGMRGTTDNVEVYQNVIDARGCTGGAGGGCAPMWMGSDVNPADDTYPSGNRVHDNWIYTDGNNQMIALETTESLELDNRFWNNTITFAGDSYALLIDPLGGAQTDVEFAYFAFIDSSTQEAVELRSVLSGVADVDICESTVNGSPLTGGDVTNNGSGLPAGEPGITSSPCLCETAGLGCGPTAGARSEAAGVLSGGSAFGVRFF